MRDLPARPIARRLRRLSAALAVAIGLAGVPIATVDACSCVGWSFPRSIREADVAFIGTMMAIGGPGAGLPGWETTQVAFDVDRAKDEMATPFLLDARLGDSAGCGLSMAIGQEWLVLAHLDEGGRPQTNLCSGSTVLAALDDPTLQVITDELDAAPSQAAGDVTAGSTDGESPSSIPLPVLLAAGAALLIVVTSLVAFRKSRPG